MKNIKKIPISMGGNEKAIEKYNKILDIVNNLDYRMWMCSDGVTNLDMLGFKHHLIAKIEHLSKEEQTAIIIRYGRINQLKSLMGRTKSQIYGVGGVEGLLEARKAEVLELFAMYYSIDEIHKKLLEESGLQMNISTVKRFYKKYRVEIEKLQLEYDNEYGTIGISRKRSRLEILDLMLRRIKQEFDKSSGKNMLPYGREMKNILEQARKEVEGDQLHLNINGTINITATIESAKSVTQLYSDINFMTLLISRVAARMRINPLLLNYQLANSWYAKFTGIKRNESLMDEIPNYPSEIILNWNDLQQKAEAKEREYKVLKQKFTEEVDIIATEEEVSQADKLRAALREKLLEKQNYVQDAENRIKGIKNK